MVTVQIYKRTYQVGQKELQGLLELASQQVPQGIYAVEVIGKNYYELRRDLLSKSQIKRITKEYRKRGMKVYANGI